MSVNRKTHQQVDRAAADATASLAAAPNGTGRRVAGLAEPSRLRLKVIERTAIVRFADSEFLLGDGTAQEVIGQLEHLVEAEGHSRLLLNLGGVRWLSSEMLAALVSFQREMDRSGGRIQLCNLDPLVRDLLRTSRLDHLFDTCADEAEALGILIR
jgi:anti-sigma B factor antagonist